MIIGIGTDICSIERIKEIEKKYKEMFLEKFLSPEEISLSKNRNYYAFLGGRFAAKEALQKAVSKKIIEFSKISILNDDNGKPFLKEPEVFLKNCGFNKKAQVHISISHEMKYACAFVIIENIS